MSNEIKIRGSLGADAELRYTPNGRPVLNLRVADGKSRRTETGDWEEVRPTIWHNATVWGRYAEALANTNLLVKGAQVEVTGELSIREYEHNGEKRWSSDVTVKQIGIIEPRNNNNAQPAQGNSFAQSAPNSDPWAADGAGYDSEPPF